MGFWTSSRSNNARSFLAVPLTNRNLSCSIIVETLTTLRGAPGCLRPSITAVSSVFLCVQLQNDYNRFIRKYEPLKSTTLAFPVYLLSYNGSGITLSEFIQRRLQQYNIEIQDYSVLQEETCELTYSWHSGQQWEPKSC